MSIGAFRLPTLGPVAKIGMHHGMGGFQHRDLGGGIGGVTPSSGTQDPQTQRAIDQYSNLSPEKLQELAVRMQGTPQASIIQRILQQKQFQPQAAQPALSPTFQRGGGIAHRAGGGSMEEPKDFFLDTNPPDPTNQDYANAGLNAASFLIPGVGGIVNAIDLGQGAVKGYNDTQHPNSDTVYGIGGDNTQVSAPKHPDVAGSQFLGNQVYGTGMAGWLGRGLGDIAARVNGAFSTPDIEADPSISSNFGSQPQTVQAPTIAPAYSMADLAKYRDPNFPDSPVSWASNIGQQQALDAVKASLAGGGGGGNSAPSEMGQSGSGIASSGVTAQSLGELAMADQSMMAPQGSLNFGAGRDSYFDHGGSFSFNNDLPNQSMPTDMYIGANVKNGKDPLGNDFLNARGGQVGKRARGGIAGYDNGGGVSLSEGAPWWTRQEASSINHGNSGFLSGNTLGRADSVATSAPSGSYIVPADVVAGLGESNSLAGARVLDEILRSGPWGTPQKNIARGSGPPRPPAIKSQDGYAKGGDVEHRMKNPVPVLLSHGEYSVSVPDVVRLGGGSLKRGHKLLDAFVLHQRKKHIATLKALKPPVGAKAS